MNILKILCDAQNRFATAAGIEAVVEVESGERMADPRDGLLAALWYVLDADSSIMLRMGDAEPVEIDMGAQVTLVGDVLTLGDTVIDLSAQKVEYMNDLARTTQFLIDGTPLRFTYFAGHVDGNIEAMDALSSMAVAVEEGEIPGILVEIDGVQTVIGADDISRPDDEDMDALWFGKVFSYDGLNGPLLDGGDQGPIEGLDFKGRLIRISRIEKEEARLAA